MGCDACRVEGMMIPDDVIEQIRDAADPVEIIGEFVDLRKTGTDYRGPCPFHGGSKRNLAVIPRKQMFFCFVCNEGGDVFSFMMKRFGLDYPHAVREIANKVGVVIPERPTGGPDPAEPLYSAVSVAADWYARRLREADDAAHARAYLKEREFDLDRLAPFGMGFAPKGPVFLKAMEKLGIADNTLLEAGLALTREDGSIRPRFWGRLLVSIHDVRGRVVGFGGRALGDAEPKYLNSPESTVFHKSQLLYNLHNAKQSIRKEGRAILVEGYFDVIRAVESGFENVVAPLGTAFSVEWAKLLKRLTKEVVVLYDSDTAGKKASFRACDELLKISIRPFIATAPPGEDPDTLVRSGGPAALKQVLDDAMDVFDRKLDELERRGWLGSLAGRRRALDRLLPTLRATDDSVTRDLYISRAAEVLDITAQSIRLELNSGPGGPTRQHIAPAATTARHYRMRPDRDLINAMLHEPMCRAGIAQQLPDGTLLEQPERELFDLLCSAPPTFAGAELVEKVSPPARQMLEELLESEWQGIDFSKTVAGAVSRIQSRPLARRLTHLEGQLPFVAESEKTVLQREIAELSREISELNPTRWRAS